MCFIYCCNKIYNIGIKKHVWGDGGGVVLCYTQSINNDKSITDHTVGYLRV